jgi:hypothetical protein
VLAATRPQSANASVLSANLDYFGSVGTRRERTPACRRTSYAQNSHKQNPEQKANNHDQSLCRENIVEFLREGLGLFPHGTL